MADVRRLVWNPANVAHIARHGVTAREAQEVAFGQHFDLQSYGGRLTLIGATSAGRMLAVIVEALDLPDTFFVVTARPASRKERRQYQSRMEGRSI